MGAMHNWLISFLFATLALIQGCGGGGGTAVPAPASTTGAGVVGGSNVQPISVDAGLGGGANLASTSITLCVPNTDNCQTIDHIVVDTGSSGLRIVSSVLAPSLSLPQQTQANGDPLVECAHFADGFIWGPVKRADLRISGEQANALPIQVMGDPQFGLVPGRCAATGQSIGSVAELHANGILGLGVFRQDCGSACATSIVTGIYFSCPAAGCQQALTPVALQVQQPVTKFAVNNNGVIIALPQVPAAGAASVSGSLLFGIGTQANNALGAARVIGVDPGTGNFITTFNNTNYNASFIDSGSNALFFQDTQLAVCGGTTAAPGFYCPASTFNGTAIIQGATGGSATVNFSIANAATLFSDNPGFAAFGNLGAPLLGTASFDWGIPFFYGRNVYTALEGAVTPGGPTGPYVAF